MNGLQQLLDIYRSDPCRTLPNAFWKTATRWANAELDLTRNSAGEVSSLILREAQRVMAFWCADPSDPRLPRKEIVHSPFALVHADSLSVFSVRDFSHRRAYFRLINQHNPGQYPCPPDFTTQQVNPEQDIPAVVSLISACYASIKINPQIVQSWLQHPVYDPHLWLWIIDVKRGEKAGLGIAERDPQVPEASLEWIQVHPAYHNRGLGKALVSELTRRALQGVKFVTVSGEIANEYQPEQLYRRCGFTGMDIWWLLSDGS